MSTNVVNQVAFLINSREFPEEISDLSTILNRSYIDIATAVNVRTIGIYPATRPAITGNSYFFNNQRQQTLRQVYTFTTLTPIAHGINGTLGIDPAMFVQAYGSYTDGTNGFGLIWGNSGGAIPNNISFYLTPLLIVFQLGAGAAPLTSGKITLEWLSAV